ncbi:MAG: translocation/assembly module TamB domain-containing protein, partial [Vibrio sp.]
RLGWDKVGIAADLANNKLDMNWLVDLTNNGSIQGQATIPDVRKEDLTIQGKNSIKPINFGFLQPVIGEDNKLEAQLQSELTFNGPIMQPKVNGLLEIVNLNLEGRAFPIDIKNSKIEADFNGYSALLKSDLLTEDGKLALTGDANWADMQNWRVNLGILADELFVEVPPMVKLRTNTDLQINMSPEIAKISGEVNLPYARIKVAQLPESAVSVSSDEVILDQNLEPVVEDDALPMLMQMAIAVNIGDDVHVSAFGLETDLEGHLKVSQKNKGPFVLGDIEMVDGTYASFGQDLIIQEGKISMNGPVDQPYVTIKAIRNPDSTEDDVVAGVYISGPADAPKAEVFSEPSMSQTNALSYLLRGRGVDDDTGGNSMATALIGLSLAKGNQTVGNVGEKIGIEDMQLGTAGSGDDAQVTVSGYIAPGLQVMYGMGIFDAVGEFTVRYELFKDFYVQAVTGVDSAVDALYQFEFDNWW